VHPKQPLVDVMRDLFFGSPTVTINAVINPQILVAKHNCPATSGMRGDTKAIGYPLRISRIRHDKVFLFGYLNCFKAHDVGK
jgi:hypothetical protein